MTLEAQLDQILSEKFDAKLSEMLKAYEEAVTKGGIQLSNADRVGPEARHKLKGILKHYAKMAHPFTACVADNRKRFGPKAEGVCAVLKDIIRGTTKWRGKNNPRDHWTPGLATAMSENEMIDEQIYRFCSHLVKLGEEGELDLAELIGYADSPEEDGTPYRPLHLDYPIAGPARPALAEKDTKFLRELHTHHSKRLAIATKHVSDADAHPDTVGIARDAVNDSTSQMARINRMLKTGSPYG